MSAYIMNVRRRSNFILVLLSIVPLVHLLNINNLDNEKSSKLKIAPLYCVSPRYENITGVCMLSLECKEKNGTIIGSCFNQYLMGACCHDPTYGFSVSSTTEMTDTILANSSTILPNTSHNGTNNTNTNATAVVGSETNANDTSTQITQSLNTTVSPTVDFSSTTTTTGPFSQKTTVRATTNTKAKNGTSSIKVKSGVKNKSSSSVKKHSKPNSSTTKKHNGKIKSSSTEKYTSSKAKAKAKGNAKNKHKTAPNLADKEKKKNSASASGSTNPTTMKTTKKPTRNTVAPTPAINNNKTTTKSAMTTSMKTTTATTPKSTTIITTTEPSTTTMKITPESTTIPTSTTTTTLAPELITTTTTTTPATTTITTTIPPTTTAAATTTTTTIPPTTTTEATTTTITTTIPPTTTTTAATTTTTTIPPTTTTTATTTTTSTSEISTTNEVDNGRIEVAQNNLGVNETPDTEETTLVSNSQGNIELFDDQKENNENGQSEPNNSIEADSVNDSDSFFSDEDISHSSSAERSHEITEDNSAEENKISTLTLSGISSSTESAVVSSTTAATAKATPTVTATTKMTTTTTRPTHKSKKRKHKKKASSKRHSTTTTTIPTTKRSTTERTQPPETISTKKIKKNKPTKRKGTTTEIPTFYITPTRKHLGSTTEKSSINFSLSEDELETDIDDFINQVVQSLAESLDGSPIDESLNKLQTSSYEMSSTKRIDTKQPSVPKKPSKKNSTEKVWDFKRDCGIRPLVKSGRIVGGTPSKFGAWPWHALIKETTWWGIFSKVKCGGVLISHRFVLTAGHCKPTTGGTLTVALGVTNTETADSSANIMNVRRFITHPRFNPKTYDNDIAIVELERPVEYQPHIVPICMPNPNEVFAGRKAIVTGMGLLRHDGERPLNLHEVDVPILENEDCQQMFAASGNPKPIRDSFICAGYAHGRKDSCGGDSGGGLQLQRESGQWVLAGTVSHGIKCALPNQPGVYMRMTHYKPWINKVITMANRGRHEFYRPNPAMLGHPKTPASEGMLSDFILKLLKMFGRFWSSERIPD